jgi:hypothetical protein
MRVFNSFEDKFEGDIWSSLSKELGSTLSECVVALASFNGEYSSFDTLDQTFLFHTFIRLIINDQIMIYAEGARHFACTGVFIDSYPARILTSASLVRSSGDKSKIYDNLWVSTFFNHYLLLLYAHCNTG